MNIKIQKQLYCTINRSEAQTIRIQYVGLDGMIVLDLSEEEAKSLSERIVSFFEMEQKPKNRK